MRHFLSPASSEAGRFGMLSCCVEGLMPEVRVELTRGCPHRILSPARLPFRHSGSGPGNIAGLLGVENQALLGSL